MTQMQTKHAQAEAATTTARPPTPAEAAVIRAAALQVGGSASAS